MDHMDFVDQSLIYKIFLSYVTVALVDQDRQDLILLIYLLSLT
jgi:hypothetical protein